MNAILIIGGIIIALALIVLFSCIFVLSGRWSKRLRDKGIEE